MARPTKLELSREFKRLCEAFGKETTNNLDNKPEDIGKWRLTYNSVYGYRIENVGPNNRDYYPFGFRHRKPSAMLEFMETTRDAISVFKREYNQE